MSQLKVSTMKSIYDALDNQIFSADDFVVEFPKTGSVLAKVKFAHNNDYYFHIAEVQKARGVAATIASFTDDERIPATIECPGDYKRVEENRVGSFDSCISRIQRWCENIKADLKTKIPVYKDLDDLKRQFEQHISEHIKNPEDQLSEEEVRKINDKFDALYAEFVKLSEEHKITQSLLSEIKKDFEIIKGNATQYSKGMWANLAKNRIVQVIKKVAGSPEGRKLMYDGAKRLLGLD